jgi:hypothetical protein
MPAVYSTTSKQWTSADVRPQGRDVTTAVSPHLAIAWCLMFVSQAVGLVVATQSWKRSSGLTAGAGRRNLENLGPVARVLVRSDGDVTSPETEHGAPG